ncbi:transcriptional regulator, partial [Bacteroides thetaiotaomicron]
LLWIKDYHKLMCIDLHQEKYIPHLDSYFRRKEIHEPVEDLFVDNSGRIWLLTSQELRELETGIRLALPENEHRKLQDIHSDELAVYLFYHTGEVVCYDPKTGKQLYDRAAYPASEQENFNRTSLVVKSKKGFYQLRNGRKGGFFYFNPQNRTWEKLFEQNYTLNTLVITPQGDKAYISCVHGFWIIDLESREQQYIPVLETKKGQLVSTEVSTIFQDAQGGLWVGTLNRGLLYHHPATHKLIHVSRTAFPASPEEDVAVKAFAEDDNGNIYLKSHSTIYQLAVDQDGSRTLLPVPASSVSAELAKELDQRGGNKYYRGQSYTALCTDTRGWIWAGTSDGLELFTDQEQTPDSKPTTQTADNQSASPNKQAHRIFYRENGLSNNFVQSIIEDRNNYIWVTTSNGISRIHINPENQEIGFTNFNQLDGALEEEYIQGAIFESSDGTLYFGGIDGFTIFRPDHESATPGLPYKPVFTNLHLYGEKVNTGEKYGNR